MGKVSKEKQAETLKRMKETRAQDSIHLRRIIDKKLEWAKAEHQKGLDAIVSLKKRIEETEATVLRLEGCISGCVQVLAESKEKAEQEKDNK